jgi:hypothetical protein
MSSAICNLKVEPDKRVRRRCPWHKKVESATFRVCYDTYYLFFDCGATVTMGDEGEKIWYKGPKRNRKK